ncbi:MAG TPA: hypothetical protein VIT62_14510 [Lysobacter sp.]
MNRAQQILCALGAHRWRQIVSRQPELLMYDDGKGHTITQCAAWHWGPEVKCTACGKKDLQWSRGYGMRTCK